VIHKSIIIGFVLFTILFFLFYPANTGIVDETAYLSMAYTFQNGKLYYDQAGIYSAPASIKTNHHLISRYPPGNSILLLPFTKLNYKLTFLRGYLLTIIGFILLIIILAHYNLPSYYALLLLFHPSIVLYTRTIMSDLPAAIFSLAGLLLFIKKRYPYSGIIFGIAIAIRYPLLLIPFSMFSVLFVKKEFFNALKFLIGVVIGLIPLLIYHISSFNTIIGPAKANLIGFSLKNFPIMFTQFFLIINIIYPLLFIISFKTKLNEKWYFIFPALIFIIFFSLQYYIDTGKNFFETIIRGQRYMLPIIPFLLIPYSEILNRIRFLQKSLPFFIIALIFVDILIIHRHQEFLIKQTHYQNKLYEYTKDADMIICNKDIYELINPYIKPIPWISFEDRKKPMQIKIPEKVLRICLACKTDNADIKKLFFELLEKFPRKEKVIQEDFPYYFSIWVLK
jgi:hypothetical protein